MTGPGGSISVRQIAFSAFLVLATIAVQRAGASGPQVTNLRGEPAASSRSAPFPLVAKIAPTQGRTDNFSNREKYAELKLANALRDANLFTAVIYPAGQWAETDVTVRGRIQETWPSAANENFTTFFPGGLWFAPLWKGIRYPFEATATIELLESSSGRKVGDYSATTSQLFVHTSRNPAHFLGALIIVPGVIRGLAVGEANSVRRDIIREEAYKDLWRDIAGQIVGSEIALEPRSKSSTGDGTGPVVPDQCAGRRDELPVIGQDWESYRSCQSNVFRLSGQVAVPQGVASVFQDDRADGIVVRVVDGKVLSWERKGR